MVAAVGDGAGPWGHSLGFELQGFFSFRNHKSILVCIRACDFWSGFVSCSLLSVRARLGSVQSCEFGPAPPPPPPLCYHRNPKRGTSLPGSGICSGISASKRLYMLNLRSEHSRPLEQPEAGCVLPG